MLEVEIEEVAAVTAKTVMAAAVMTAMEGAGKMAVVTVTATIETAAAVTAKMVIAAAVMTAMEGTVII
jgi:hypothetical protein